MLAQDPRRLGAADGAGRGVTAPPVQGGSPGEAHDAPSAGLRVLPRHPRLDRVTGVPLPLHIAILPVWFALTCGVAVGVAGSDSAWGGALLLAVLGYPVALVAAAVLVRAARCRGDDAAARLWRLLPMPWFVAIVAFLLWALNR